MNGQPAPDLTKVTEVFLVPSSFIVAALAAADSNPHRAAVSLLGLVISGLWWVCGREAYAELAAAGPPDPAPPRPPRRVRIFLWLPAFFMACWAGSLVAHLLLWGQPLGH